MAATAAGARAEIAMADDASCWRAAKAKANFISLFVGRLDDIGEKGMDLIEDIVDIIEDIPEDFDWWEPQDKLDGQPAGEYIDEAVYNWFENQ